MFGIDLFKLIGGGVAVSVLVGSCVARDWRIEQRGAAKTVAKIEKATTDVVKKADAAGRKSVSGTGGVRNPHYRD